ncbi:MAG: alpha/beta fold hydrolase [Leptospirales bacterium]|jgi:pimeloyl-ACP methyl ester carboxylesterase
MRQVIKSGRFVSVENIRIHYQEYGEGHGGPPVLLVHGWPTSSFLWRNVAPHLAHGGRRVIALDLPGFGLSDKPLNETYSFRFFSKIVDGFLRELSISGPIALVVHDLGGPIGVYWACANAERVERLALLNTLIYPEMSWAVKLFVLSLRLPIIRTWITSPGGLGWALRLGVADPAGLAPDAIPGTREPFQSKSARTALLRAGRELSVKGFVILSQRLKKFKIPVRMIYGARDRILPDIADTARRLQADLPHAEITALPDCGHFLQEDQPDVVGELLADFFGPARNGKS